MEYNIGEKQSAIEYVDLYWELDCLKTLNKLAKLNEEQMDKMVEDYNV